MAQLDMDRVYGPWSGSLSKSAAACAAKVVFSMSAGMG